MRTREKAAAVAAGVGVFLLLVSLTVMKAPGQPMALTSRTQMMPVQPCSPDGNQVWPAQEYVLLASGRWVLDGNSRAIWDPNIAVGGAGAALVIPTGMTRLGLTRDDPNLADFRFGLGHAGDANTAIYPSGGLASEPLRDRDANRARVSSVSGVTFVSWRLYGPR